MAIQLYNTLTRTKTLFEPMNPPQVTMYVCGPTVYDSAHIGHAMSYLIFDMVRRYLEYRGYTVKLAQNFTDVDDKIIVRSKKTGEVWTDIIERYIQDFKEDMTALNILHADVYPRATEEVPEILTMIQGLIDKGYAYPSDGDVFFRVQKDEDYGKLNNRKLDEQLAGERLSEAEKERKEDPLDFVLWKGAKEGEPAWDSPWGKGRPGWHIECSAMSLRYLGAQIDIHGGGDDLKFPHHENEIAQTESYTGKVPFVKYWIHNGLLKVPKPDEADKSAEEMEKMGKSLKNAFAIRNFLQHHSADALRLFVLSSHYRRPVVYTEESFAAAERAVERFHAALAPAQPDSTKESKELTTLIEQVADEFHKAMDDDLNTALAMGELFKFASAINRARDEGVGGATLAEAQASLRKLLGVLGFTMDKQAKPLADASATPFIELLIELRTNLRKAKQYALADEVRQKLAGLGVVLEDTPQGTQWKFE
jgi:cysteinyl-tRNA synthetase